MPIRTYSWSLPVLSDGLGVCVGRSALSTIEPADDPSSLSPPHAPTHIHVSLPTTLRLRAVKALSHAGGGEYSGKVAVSVARLSVSRSPAATLVRSSTLIRP